MGPQRRVLWLNGTFGVGKTTTARHICSADATWHVFDPEWVGYMLRANLSGFETADFQDLPAWRTLVPRVAHEVATHTGKDLLAVQTVLRQDYWRQLRAGLSSHGMQVVHVVLDAGPDVLADRIRQDQADPNAAAWRLDHVAAYQEARAWMTGAADLVVDTGALSAVDTAQKVLAHLGDRDRG